MVTSLYGKVSTETHVLGSTEIESPEPTDADVEKQTERVHYVLEEPSNYQHVTIFYVTRGSPFQNLHMHRDFMLKFLFHRDLHLQWALPLNPLLQLRLQPNRQPQHSHVHRHRRQPHSIHLRLRVI